MMSGYKRLFLTAILILAVSVSFATLSTLTFKGGLSRPETDIDKDIQLNGMIGMSYEIWLAKWVSLGLYPYVTNVRAGKELEPNFRSVVSGSDLLFKIRPHWKYIAPYLTAGGGIAYFYPKTVENSNITVIMDDFDHYAKVLPTVGAGISFFTNHGIDFDLGLQKNMMMSDYLDGLKIGDGDDSYWMAFLGISHTFGYKNPEEKARTKIVKAEPMLMVSATNLGFASAKGMKTIMLASNLDWTAQSSDAWLNVTPAAGKGDANITVSYDENTSLEPRSGQVIITGGSFTRVVMVKQNEMQEKLLVSPTIYQVQNNAGTAYFAVESNITWTVTEDAEWFSITSARGKGNGAIEVAYQSNPERKARMGQIVVTAGSQTQTLTITQDRVTPMPFSENKPLILKGVNFLTGSSDLEEDSFGVLDEVAASLAYYPLVEVEIQGYTDNTGSQTANKRLSLERAITVKAYLITKGIADSRMTVKGYGPENPIASNSTSDGRAQNRRIEFLKTK
jgi:outer membrane protein OmpA-like peptidoglycan-associated protein